MDSNNLSRPQRAALEDRYRSLLGPAVVPSRFKVVFESFEWAVHEMSTLVPPD